jgi:hypothetical protein
MYDQLYGFDVCDLFELRVVGARIAGRIRKRTNKMDKHILQ